MLGNHEDICKLALQILGKGSLTLLDFKCKERVKLITLIQTFYPKIRQDEFFSILRRSRSENIQANMYRVA